MIHIRHKKEIRQGQSLSLFILHVIQREHNCISFVKQLQTTIVMFIFYCFNVVTKFFQTTPTISHATLHIKPFKCDSTFGTKILFERRLWIYSYEFEQALSTSNSLEQKLTACCRANFEELVLAAMVICGMHRTCALQLPVLLLTLVYEQWSLDVFASGHQ